MRKKNPAIQKWVNSIQQPDNQASTSYTNDETKIDYDKTVEDQRPNVLITQKLTEDTSEVLKCSSNPDNEQPISIKRILDKISKSSEKLDISDKERGGEEDQDNKKKSSYFYSGKNKINEFYEKINLNKSKYSLVKTKKMDIKEKVEQCQQSLSKNRKSFEKLADEIVPEQAIFHLEEEENAVDYEKNNILKNSDDDEEQDRENIEKISKQPKMRDIGRSRSENPSLKKRYNLQEIGRSFSEMKDDENIENIERNHTYPYPMSSSLNTSSNLALSTQNMFAKSVPVSPIPRKECKMRRRQTLMKDNSLQSDSSHCSSVESLLNARKPDPEMILVNLGFGPANTSDVLTKIPKR